MQTTWSSFDLPVGVGLEVSVGVCFGVTDGVGTLEKSRFFTEKKKYKSETTVKIRKITSTRWTLLE